MHIERFLVLAFMIGCSLSSNPSIPGRRLSIELMPNLELACISVGEFGSNSPTLLVLISERSRFGLIILRISRFRGLLHTGQASLYLNQFSKQSS